MKKQKEESKLKEKGITLIALVVTIIVLLILAGVSIAMLTGEGGIIKQAEEAKDRTGRANLIETVQMEIFEKITTREGSLSEEDLHDILSKYFSNVPDIESEEWTNFPEGFPKLTATKENGSYDIEIGEIYGGKLNNANEEGKYLKPGEKAQTTTKNNYKDENNKLATIPKDFHVSTKEGEKNVEDGLVIIDDDGNEFVWVPCSGENGEVVYEKKNGLATTWNAESEDGTQYSSKQLQYTNYNDWTDNGGNETSVNNYGGFYIGRYEAGIPSGADFYGATEGAEYKKNVRNITTEKPVSKKNNPSWNMITQENAVKVSTDMYGSNASVISQLIDSYAWDTVVDWIKIGKGAVNKVTESTTYGNYSNNTNISLGNNGLYAMHVECIDEPGHVMADYFATKYSVGNWSRTESDKKITSTNINTDYSRYEWSIPHSTWDYEKNTYKERTEIATGAAETTKTKNIYDLAGNMWEWTTEIGKHDTYDVTYTVVRGGGFRHPGSGYSVCSRHGNNKSGSACVIDTGFRVVLYIK